MPTIKAVEFEYSIKQNIGDYSNVTPRVVLHAEINEGEDPELVLSGLIDHVKRELHSIVDDELEKVGREVKYHAGPLYELWENKRRFCVVLAPANVPMPEVSNWKESDNWLHHAEPRQMREPLAVKRFHEVAEKKRAGEDLSWDENPGDGPKWIAVDCRDGDLSRIPPLPDAGPEPLWHSKDLSSNLQSYFNIPKDRWEDIASLDWVDKSYLKNLYDNRSRLNLTYVLPEALILWIAANPTIPDPEPVPVGDDPDYDEDDDDYEDDDD